MKISINMTTSQNDVERYVDAADMEGMLEGFDGLELMCFEDDERGVIPQGRVTGVHMVCYTNWVDLWNEDEEALIGEYGSLDVVEQVFGGLTRQVLIDHHRKDLENARKYGAEYLVFHASDVFMEESIRFKEYHVTDEEVLQATGELMDAVFSDEDGSMALLLENLWCPGFRFDSHENTRLLLDSVSYSNKGIMLDTGHLLHTNWDLQTEDEAVDYILDLVAANGDLCQQVRGIHLNQSLTGDVCYRLIEEQPPAPEDYWDRWCAMFTYAFQIDQHKPWTTPRIKEVIEALGPEWLTFEFISNNREEHEKLLRQQWAVLEDLRRN